jgi:conjugal transfer pilin signal peptidase TrbI
MLDALHVHVARRAPVYLWMLVGIAAFGRWFALTLNVSDSLPGTVFLVQKGTKPDKGQLAAFRYAGGGPYERGSLFLKQMLGVPGSLVIGMDIGSGYRDYLVDGQYAGRAKPRSKTGMPLEPGPSGVIPAGRYYMAAPNPDSLDSRYALVGWVTEDQIVGRAFRIF